MMSEQLSKVTETNSEQILCSKNYGEPGAGTGSNPVVLSAFHSVQNGWNIFLLS